MVIETFPIGMAIISVGVLLLLTGILCYLWGRYDAFREIETLKRFIKGR